MAEYERHEPEKALLRQVIREQLEGFLASAAHVETRSLRAWPHTYPCVRVRQFDTPRSLYRET